MALQTHTPPHKLTPITATVTYARAFSHFAAFQEEDNKTLTCWRHKKYPNIIDPAPVEECKSLAVDLSQHYKLL